MSSSPTYPLPLDYLEELPSAVAFKLGVLFCAHTNRAHTLQALAKAQEALRLARRQNVYCGSIHESLEYEERGVVRGWTAAKLEHDALCARLKDEFLSAHPDQVQTLARLLSGAANV